MLLLTSLRVRGPQLHGSGIRCNVCTKKNRAHFRMLTGTPQPCGRTELNPVLVFVMDWKIPLAYTFRRGFFICVIFLRMTHRNTTHRNTTHPDELRMLAAHTLEARGHMPSSRVVRRPAKALCRCCRLCRYLHRPRPVAAPHVRNSLERQERWACARCRSAGPTLALASSSTSTACSRPFLAAYAIGVHPTGSVASTSALAESSIRTTFTWLRAAATPTGLPLPAPLMSALASNSSCVDAEQLP